ncbi:hypothetical protein TSUD_67170 [Trifolium subterraneum]|uniref:Protein kinase domain-containing protein n=1 Tax=Trifolium subterraneum TaxID=3900 RepID=A0A2Z6NX86_TRISU|nr:hypothetical protein TSUD_67170 [Trifolium subterraneum]
MKANVSSFSCKEDEKKRAFYADSAIAKGIKCDGVRIEVQVTQEVEHGVAVAAVASAIFVGIAFYIYYGRKKKKNIRAVSSTVLSRSISSSSSEDSENGSRYHGVHFFTYSELEKATNNFDSIRALGDGGFGTVYFGKLRDGRLVAVKRMNENNYRRVEQFIQNGTLHELVDPTLGFESDFKIRKMINAVAELAFQCLQSSKDVRPSMVEVLERLKDIQSDEIYKCKPEVLDISVNDDITLIKNEPPPSSPDSNIIINFT